MTAVKLVLTAIALGVILGGSLAWSLEQGIERAVQVVRGIVTS